MLLRLIQRMLGVSRASSRVEVVEDRVWLSTRAKLAGIRRELHDRAIDGTAVVALVAHFPDVLEELRSIASDYEGAATVAALLCRELSPENAGDLPLRESDVVDVIVAERHPLRSVDDTVIEFAEVLPCRSRIVFHVALDDPVLRVFGSESIRPMMDGLGATGDEALTHRMITRSIRRAQEDIETRSRGRFEADSAAEWLERNMPLEAR